MEQYITQRACRAFFAADEEIKPRRLELPPQGTSRGWGTTPPQGTRKGYPYHGRVPTSQARSSMVGVPLAGTLGRGYALSPPSQRWYYALAKEEYNREEHT